MSRRVCGVVLDVTVTPDPSDGRTPPTPEGGHSAGEGPVAVEVYWRPGCGFCNRLFRQLGRAGVVVRRHNIWEDDDARSFVRAHNRGNETVPTVEVAGIVSTNPSPEALVEQVRQRWPHLIGEVDERSGLLSRLRPRS